MVDVATGAGVAGFGTGYRDTVFVVGAGEKDQDPDCLPTGLWLWLRAAYRETLKIGVVPVAERPSHLFHCGSSGVDTFVATESMSYKATGFSFGAGDTALGVPCILLGETDAFRLHSKLDEGECGRTADEPGETICLLVQTRVTLGGVCFPDGRFCLQSSTGASCSPAVLPLKTLARSGPEDERAGRSDPHCKLTLPGEP